MCLSLSRLFQFIKHLEHLWNVECSDNPNHQAFQQYAGLVSASGSSALAVVSLKFDKELRRNRG